eukprot:265864-Prymnesium_polylepis.1
MHYLDSRTDHVKRRKTSSTSQEARSSVGWFETLPEALQEAMVEMARQLRQDARAWERRDRKE